MISYTTDVDGAKLEARIVNGELIIVQMLGSVETPFTNPNAYAMITPIPGCSTLTWGDFASPACIKGCLKTPVSTNAGIRANITILAQSIEALGKKLGATPVIVLGWITTAHSKHISSDSAQLNDHFNGLAADVRFLDSTGKDVDIRMFYGAAVTIGHYDTSSIVPSEPGTFVRPFSAILIQSSFVHLSISSTASSQAPVAPQYKGSFASDWAEAINGKLLSVPSGVAIPTSTNANVSKLDTLGRFGTLGDISKYLKVDAATLYYMNFGHACPIDTDPATVSAVPLTSVYYPNTPANAFLLGAETHQALAANSDTIKGGIIAEYAASKSAMMVISSDMDKYVADGMTLAQAANAEAIAEVSSLKGTDDSYKSARTYVRTHALKSVPYERACLVVTTQTKTTYIDFVLNPNSLNIGYSNVVTPQKTSAGWFLSRQGGNLISISFTGNLFDAVNIEEKHLFLEAYKQNCVDQKTMSDEYVNESIVYLYIEGVKYTGYVSSINLVKSTQQQVTYSYSLSFIGVDDTYMQYKMKNGDSTSSDSYFTGDKNTDDDTDPSPSGHSTGDVIINPPPPSHNPDPVVKFKTAKVTASSLNVRSGPGTNYKVVSSKRKNDSITIYGTKKPWLKIDKTKNLWLHGSYTTYKF